MHSVSPRALSSPEELIAEAKAGRMIILVDDENRENEGDLVIPAEMCTDQSIAFMATHARGLVCLAITQGRADELKLPQMTAHNRAPLGTAFTVSVEAAEGVTTGISAQDRARTVAVAIDPAMGPKDIVVPGHVFPLTAREGGVLVRAGHTEAAVDIARLAGLNPSGVICEVMKDDGTMARLPDLIEFAGKHGLKIGTIADLIAYRRRYDRFVKKLAAVPFESDVGGAWQAHVYVNTNEYAEHIALVKGDISGPEPVLVRMHAMNPLTDALAEAGSGNKLAASMAVVAETGRGVVVLLRPARASFVSDQLLHRAQEDADRRRVKEAGVGAQMLLDLGIKNMVLLTDTPEKSVVALDGFDLNIVATRPIRLK